MKNLALTLLALITLSSGCAHRQVTNGQVAGVVVIAAVIALPLIVGVATGDRPPAAQ